MFYFDYFYNGFGEVVPYKVGFRRIEIIDKVIHLNGKRLILVGVNRHEWSAKTGRVIGMEEMISDMECIKKNNINKWCSYIKYKKKRIYKCR